MVGNLSKDDKVQMQKFIEAVQSKDKNYPENVIKTAYIYYKILNGKYESRHISIYNNLKNDFPRVAEILKGIDSLAKNWKQKDFLKTLSKRMQYGVPAKLVDLIEIKGVGKIKAEKLYAQGFASREQIVNRIDEAAKVCGIKKETLLKNISTK
jgi:replicative superfamily II helicase